MNSLIGVKLEDFRDFLDMKEKKYQWAEAVVPGLEFLNSLESENFRIHWNNDVDNNNNSNINDFNSATATTEMTENYNLLSVCWASVLHTLIPPHDTLWG